MCTVKMSTKKLKIRIWIKIVPSLQFKKRMDTYDTDKYLLFFET